MGQERWFVIWGGAEECRLVGSLEVFRLCVLFFIFFGYFVVSFWFDWFGSLIQFLLFLMSRGMGCVLFIMFFVSVVLGCYVKLSVVQWEFGGGRNFGVFGFSDVRIRLLGQMFLWGCREVVRVVAGALAGVYGRSVGRQDFGVVRIRVFEFFFLQCFFQVVADVAQFGGDGRLAEVRVYRLRARGVGTVKVFVRVRFIGFRVQFAFTFTMCSLGSRSQSVRVSWSSFRKRRRDSRSCGFRVFSCFRGARRQLFSRVRARSSSWYRVGGGVAVRSRFGRSFFSFFVIVFDFFYYGFARVSGF